MAGSIDQGQLVGTRGVVGDILVALLVNFHVCDDRVAQAERLVEAFQVLVVLVVGIFDVIVEIGVLKVHVCDARGIVERLRIIFAVFEAARGETLELHDILRQGAGLIAEYVVDHSKLLVQIRGLHASLKTSALIADGNVVRDEVSLTEVDKLKCDKKSNGHKVHKSDEPNSQVL